MYGCNKGHERVKGVKERESKKERGAVSGGWEGPYEGAREGEEGGVEDKRNRGVRYIRHRLQWRAVSSSHARSDPMHT